MIHCDPVAESPRSRWSAGIASATIVWSMKIIATAKIIATSTRVLFGIGSPSAAVRKPGAARRPAPGHGRD